MGPSLAEAPSSRSTSFLSRARALLTNKMALRRPSNMVTPPGLRAPVPEDKDIELRVTQADHLTGLWRVGSRSAWSDESEGVPMANNLKLHAERGPIDAHVVIASYARDGRPNVDIETTTGSITVKLTRTENSRFDLKAHSNSGTVTVYLPGDFHGVIPAIAVPQQSSIPAVSAKALHLQMYRSRNLATFSALAAGLRGVTMTSAPVGCGGDVDCDDTMEVIYSDRAMCCDEIPKDCDGIKISTPRGRIHFLVAGEHPPALGGVWDHLKTAIGFGRALPPTVKCKN
ncbi:hypothetical protein FRC07_000664 [Ceratobasidium sp. 392]|nr:hypothetical protein FRC07_000664 [Ceratobasidium sp. 392]